MHSARRSRRRESATTSSWSTFAWWMILLSCKRSNTSPKDTTNLVDIVEWVHNALAVVGTSGRNSFNSHLQALLEEPAVPKHLKVAWNSQVARMTLL